MRKLVLLVVIVSVSVSVSVWVSVWHGRYAAGPAADANRLIANRIWLDHIPRDDKDTIQAFFANSKDALGLFAASSQWLGRYELFRYEVHGSELRVVYPQSGDRESVRATARRCTERGMDFCLEIEGASRGVKKYYSREGWEVDHARHAGAIRAEGQVEGQVEGQAEIEALRVKLVAGK
jgi:hypothetical protein